MTDARLQHKIEETQKIAAEAGFDLRTSPLLATFEMPIWGAGIATHEVGELAREPAAHVAVVSVDPLPELRAAVSASSNFHLIAERGLVCGLSGGATHHIYPTAESEMESFAVALIAGAAPGNLRLSLSGYVSSGRQEATFEPSAETPVPSPRELIHAIRHRGGTAEFANEAEDAVVVDDLPGELDCVRAALSCDLRGQAVRVSRLPSGRFRFTPDPSSRKVDRQQLHALAQGVAMSCDRFLEVRGESTFGFVTAPVARWEFSPETGARHLADELFSAPDTVITQLGLHPFSGEGTLFFAYEGSETVWEAANKGIACITVRDILEYGRILLAIRKGE